MAIQPLRVECPHCKADWSYGWHSIYSILKFFREHKVSFIKCYACQVCWTYKDFIRYLKELTEIESG